jgi:hypothetical protein
MSGETRFWHNPQMEQTQHVLEIAVRVLVAVTNGTETDQHDVEELRRYATLTGNVSLDELACDAIHQVLKCRAEQRRKAGVI